MRNGLEDKFGLTKGSRDHRITKIGLCFRKFKLDELPQFFNVLMGDMSIVGPRPQVPYYTDKFNKYYTQILIKKPGLFSPAATIYSQEDRILDSIEDSVKYYEEVLIPTKCALDIELVEKLNVRMYFQVIWGYLKYVMKNDPTSGWK